MANLSNVLINSSSDVKWKGVTDVPATDPYLYEIDNDDLGISEDYADDPSGVIPNRESINLSNKFDIPNWGIKDYINERGAFIKQTGTILGEPTWFYFKIFFKFDTGYGLLGNILKVQDSKQKFVGQNTAFNYFWKISERYEQEMPINRLEALVKFVKTLSFISSNAPWTFQTIKELSKSLSYDFEKSTEKKSITIDLLQEAVDMRLSSLFDLYRFAAFDFAHDKEILPENLRKFDMDIVLFQVPIKYFQTSMKDMMNRTVPYKNLYDTTDLFNRMSFHLFTLQNCEFDIQSFASLIGDSISNEKPFELKPYVKINYDKCYHHSLNEWIHVLVGDGGYRYYGGTPEDEKTTKNLNLGDYLKYVTGKKSKEDLGITTKNSEATRIKMLKYGYDNKNMSANYASTNYYPLVEASEDIIGNAMRTVAPDYALGNLYKKSDWGDLLKAPVANVRDNVNNMINSFKNPVKNLFPSGGTTKGYNGFGHQGINNYYKNYNHSGSFLGW